MSVFSKLNFARKHAKERQQKTTETGSEDCKVPYKHIPTHAAIDALNGAPRSWTVDERSKIREQHRLRNATDFDRPMSSVSSAPFVHSTLNPNHDARRMVRNSSYTSFNSIWGDRGGESTNFYDRAETQRQQRARRHSFHEGSIGPSPLSSSFQHDGSSTLLSNDPSNSNSNSNASHHPDVRASSRYVAGRHQTSISFSRDVTARPHTGTARNLNESAHYEQRHMIKKGNIAGQSSQQARPRWSLLGKQNVAYITQIQSDIEAPQ